MQVIIMTVGKRSESGVEALIESYQKRIPREYQVTWQFVSASKSSEEMVCRQEESGAITKLLKPTDKVVLLDERGKQYDNKAFAAVFSDVSSSQGRVVFIIGGAYGVTDELRAAATVVWSLSQLVFPHRLIRLVLMEQLYRTIMITKGHPYHHE